MFGKVKNKINEIKEENRKRMEEAARIERERVQAEKAALMALSEKELMVEAIMALRGYNTRLKNLEEKQDNLRYIVGSLESSVDSIDSKISSIGSSVDELKYR